ncbi:formylglycine-generating enzyme family protein [Accumulibacter sp.]|uniref:formylglycine-generating enzyme family protein n=1 Tax=Accumulibacter sp. TaxID=2053492 RepID=UPI0028C43B6B|nr:formylglycine-generating enzyme family protein [Accumulibacter sp.]
MNALSREAWRRRGSDPFPPRWASAWGDDRFGLWAELAVADVVQRLRWIEAGSFRMGDERQPERQVETPIVAGFWLADTACTQALWQAVMASNPSRFSVGNSEHPGSPQHPVEQVSWNDITSPSSGFLARLQSFSQGVPPELPSEAEWEYACRAGTRSAFSFGDEVTTAQVHYNPNYRDKVGAFWAGSGMTAAVKTLPANAWGLYETHGNLGEWCADLIDGDDDAIIEESSHDLAQRAIRGGSWFHGTERARSAAQGAVEANTRSPVVGFRFLLRESPRREPRSDFPTRKL